LGEPRLERLAEGELGEELRRLGVAGAGDFKVREVGDRDMILAIAKLYGTTPHSDFYPTVALQAPRARFMNRSVQSVQNLLRVGLPVLEFTTSKRPAGADESVSFTEAEMGARDHWIARMVTARMAGQPEPNLDVLEPQVARE